MDITLKIFFITFLALAFVLGYFLKKVIPYLFCELEKYKGRIGKGKSHNLFILHFFISFGPSVTVFLMLDDFQFIQNIFQNNFNRIFSFLILWCISFFLIGTLIEIFLTLTDKEYKAWKEKNKN